MKINHKTLDMRDNLKLCIFIENLSKQFPYKDTFTSNTAINISEHTHDDFESRLFLEGTAIFTINGKTYKCNPGDYIEIPPGTKHSFEYDGIYPLKVLRFFSKDTGWVASFCRN